MIYRKIDENGFFIEDVVKPSIVDETEHFYVKTPIPDGMYAKGGVSPKWVVNLWVATAEPPEQEPSFIEPTESDRLDMLEIAILDLMME